MKLKSFPSEQRDVLVLWVSELSGICDSFVPRAPIPQLDSIDRYDLLLRWEHGERELTIFVHPETLRVTLHLRHWSKVNITSGPSHDQLKTAVRSFFEGWYPCV